MKLVKVTEVYIDADDSYQPPVFKLEDGTYLMAEYMPTGNCWLLHWKAVPAVEAEKLLAQPLKETNEH